MTRTSLLDELLKQRSQVSNFDRFKGGKTHNISILSRTFMSPKIPEPGIQDMDCMMLQNSAKEINSSNLCREYNRRSMSDSLHNCNSTVIEDEESSLDQSADTSMFNNQLYNSVDRNVQHRLRSGQITGVSLSDVDVSMNSAAERDIEIPDQGDKCVYGKTVMHVHSSDGRTDTIEYGMVDDELQSVNSDSWGCQNSVIHLTSNSNKWVTHDQCVESSYSSALAEDLNKMSAPSDEVLAAHHGGESGDFEQDKSELLMLSCFEHSDSERCSSNAQSSARGSSSIEKESLEKEGLAGIVPGNHQREVFSALEDESQSQGSHGIAAHYPKDECRNCDSPSKERDCDVQSARGETPVDDGIGNHSLQEESQNLPEKWSDQSDDGGVGFSGPLAFSGMISYSGMLSQIPYSGNLSYRSDSSTSTRSFAFPIMSHEWNSSPAKIGQPDDRYFPRRRRWHAYFCCKRPTTLFD